MKDFFKFMFASMLGFLVILTILFFIFLGLIASVATLAEKKTVSIDASTVLHIKLDTPIYDRAPKDPMAFFSPGGLDINRYPGLDEILKDISKAKDDPNIKGIYLDLGMVPSGISTIKEIRDALVDFKTSDKFIIAYGEVFSETAYYVASVADKVYLNPKGGIEFKGLAAHLFFLKGTMDKLDIDMQVIRHGKYKSAVEIFTEDKMSPANREQMDALITGIWGTLVSDISDSRKLSNEDLNRIADNLDALNPDKALEDKLVDGLYYKDEVIAELKNLTGIGEKDKIKMVSLNKYSLVPPTVSEKVSPNKIAVVYAIGSIGGGKGDDRTIGSDRLSEAIRKARENDKVKAIVLRVNSPGGSATAAEVIRREVALAAKVKPVVVSMGDVAASGGYWISASATKIIADPSTITGSIGVFGIIPNFQDFFDKKLGITFDQAMTNKYSDFPNVDRPMSDYEKMVIEREIEKIYSDFVSLVAQGRNLTESHVDSIGQGRVWSGTDALKIGLIDQFGGLQDAIKVAADLANITEYNLRSLPEQKEPFQQLIDELTGNASTVRIQKTLGEYYTYYEYLKQMKEMQGIQARLPYEIEIN